MEAVSYLQMVVQQQTADGSVVLYSWLCNRCHLLGEDKEL